MGRYLIHRTDCNQAEIKLALERAGAKVLVLNGVIDMLVMYRGRLLGMEIKRNKSAKFTKSQEAFFSEWGSDGPIRRIESAEEALQFVGAI